MYPLIPYLTRFTWKLRCKNKNGGRAGDLTGCVTILLFSCVLLEQVLTCHTKLARRRSPEALGLFLASCNSNIPRNDMSICMTPIFAYFEACAKNKKMGLQNLSTVTTAFICHMQPNFAFMSFIRKYSVWFDAQILLVLFLTALLITIGLSEMLVCASPAWHWPGLGTLQLSLVPLLEKIREYLYLQSPTITSYINYTFTTRTLVT